MHKRTERLNSNNISKHLRKLLAYCVCFSFARCEEAIGPIASTVHPESDIGLYHGARSVDPWTFNFTYC